MVVNPKKELLRFLAEDIGSGDITSKLLPRKKIKARIISRQNGAYYQQQRDKGASYQAALRALAFKWIRIVFRCWQTGTPYNESVYLAALQRRGSPLIANLAQST